MTSAGCRRVPWLRRRMLRAEWAKLDTPARIQGLADRHLALRPMKPAQFDDFGRLPPRPVVAPPDAARGMGQARYAGAHPGPGRPTSGAAADETGAIR